MIDILVFLFHSYADFAARPDAEVLTHKLKAAGFAHDEIAAALDWLEALRAAPAAAPADHRHAMRVYTAEERACLGRDGLSFLTYLEQQGLLDLRLRELIVERAMAWEAGRLTRERLKVIILIALWSQAVELDALLVEELLSEPHETMH